jgi:transcriptional regulator with XRE-family HTH domain
MINANAADIGKIIKHQRVTTPLTLHKLSELSGVSPSYLGRIEHGQRFPSARILQKIAKHIGFDEDELFALAGYLSPQTSHVADKGPDYVGGALDPYVARVLAQEPVEIQRSVIAILTMIKTIARNIS